MTTSDTAWAAIAAAQGHVQGKSLRMRKETLIDILHERGESEPFQIRERRLYGVRVTIDPLMKRGAVELR